MSGTAANDKETGTFGSTLQDYKTMGTVFLLKQYTTHKCSMAYSKFKADDKTPMMKQMNIQNFTLGYNLCKFSISFTLSCNVVMLLKFTPVGEGQSLL